MIKHSWLESGGVYGYRKIHDYLREVGEHCGRHRVARLIRFEGLRSQTGYWRRPVKTGCYFTKLTEAPVRCERAQQSLGHPMVHSDKGSQYSCSHWRSFLKANNLIASMSRRGNCHGNAVAESFLQLLKRERIKIKIYTTRQDARGDVFDYIEMLYNPKRRQSFNNQMPQVAFEKRYTASLESV